MAFGREADRLRVSSFGEMKVTVSSGLPHLPERLIVLGVVESSSHPEALMRQETVSRAILALALGGLVGCSGGERSEGSRAAEAQQTSEPALDLRDRFVGNWALVSYESFRENGEVVDNGYVARLTYDEHGNMSAVGMPRNLPGRAPAEAGEPIRAGFAYFSTYDLEPEEGRVVHHVIGSPMNPGWVGTDLIRYYAFDGDLLQLSLRNPEGRVTGTLTWRRLDSAAEQL
jgi:Lipocalin-like domain